jgi:lysophospholipase L1-like esterase
VPLLQVSSAYLTRENVVRVAFSAAIQFSGSYIPGDAGDPDNYLVQGADLTTYAVTLVEEVSSTEVDLTLGLGLPAGTGTVTVTGVKSLAGDALDPAYQATTVLGAPPKKLPVLDSAYRGARDIANVNGVWVVDRSGDLGIDEGLTQIRKRIFRRITTPTGAMAHLPGYGVGVATYVKRLATSVARTRLVTELESQIRQEPGVAAARVTLKRGVNPGLWRLSLLVRTTEGYTLRPEYDVGVLAADPPTWTSPASPTGDVDEWTLLSSSPGSGDTFAGTALVLRGTGFAGLPDVMIGGAACTDIVVVNPTKITCKAPALVAGTYSVSVTIGTQTQILPSAYTVWSPNLISDMRFWLRDTYTASSGDMTQWTDKSGNGLHFTQGTSARRPYVDDINLDVNAHPAARFLREDNQYLDAATAADWAWLHDMTTGCTVAFWLLADRQDAGEGAIFDTTNGSGANPGFGFWYNGNTTTARFLITNGVSTIITGSFTLNQVTPTFIVFRCDTAGNYSVRANGVEVASGVRTTTPSVSNPNWPLRIGNFADSYSVPSTFIMPEVIGYARNLNLTETQQLEAYATGRYSMAAYTEGTPASPTLSPITGTKKIMFVGNSITYGTGAITLTGGWRNVLNTLRTGNPNFTLQAIGPVNWGGFGGMGDAHNGRSGWTIRGNSHSYVSSGHMPNSIPGNADELDEVLALHVPDLVVVLLGTNCISTDPENIYCNNNGYDYELMVRYIAATVPGVRILCAAITPTNIATRYWLREEQYNRCVRLAVRRMQSDLIDVIFTDTYSVVNPATGISGDAVHPNDTGYTAIGNEMWTGVQRLCGY